jgi:hypothetical protein
MAYNSGSGLSWSITTYYFMLSTKFFLTHRNTGTLRFNAVKLEIFLELPGKAHIGTLDAIYLHPSYH